MHTSILNASLADAITDVEFDQGFFFLLEDSCLQSVSVMVWARPLTHLMGALLMLQHKTFWTLLLFQHCGNNLEKAVFILVL